MIPVVNHGLCRVFRPLLTKYFILIRILNKMNGNKHLINRVWSVGIDLTIPLAICQAKENNC